MIVEAVGVLHKSATTEDEEGYDMNQTPSRISIM